MKTQSNRCWLRKRNDDTAKQYEQAFMWLLLLTSQQPPYNLGMSFIFFSPTVYHIKMYSEK